MICTNILIILGIKLRHYIGLMTGSISEMSGHERYPIVSCLLIRKKVS